MNNKITLPDLDYSRHPGWTLNFDILHQNLIHESVRGYLKCVKKDGLELYNYNDKCTYEKHWNIYTIIARGLIICPEEKKIVGLSFPKFFNLSEINFNIKKYQINSVYDKLDGSLGIIFHHKLKWYVCTRGSFNSDQSNWCYNWLNNNNLFKNFNENLTYLVEIIYKENKIVVDYNFEGLILIGAYDNSTGIEIRDLDSLNTRIPTAKLFHYNDIDNLALLCKNLSVNQEGFVVKLDCGMRIKLKGDKYCELHKIMSQCTVLDIWMLVKNNVDLAKYKLSVPEEFYEFFDKTCNYFLTKYQEKLQWGLNLYETTKSLDSKQISLSQLTIEEKNIIFFLRKNDSANISNSSIIRNKIFTLFKPKNLTLP